MGIYAVLSPHTYAQEDDVVWGTQTVHDAPDAAWFSNVCCLVCCTYVSTWVSLARVFGIYMYRVKSLSKTEAFIVDRSGSSD